MSGASLAPVVRLVRKDLSLMRRPLLAYTAAAGVAVALAAGPATRGLGITLALNVLIGLSFHVTIDPVLGERQRRTLPFVLSLPVSPRDVAAAKLAAAYLMFLAPGTLAAAALVFLSPVDVFAAMATDGRTLASHLAGWLGYFGLVLGAWAALFSVVLAAAIVSESVGVTVAVISGLMFVIGNGASLLVRRAGLVVRYVRDLAAGGPSVPATLAVEAAVVCLVVLAVLWLQGRKTSFV